MAPEKLAFGNVEATIDDDGIALCAFNRPQVHNALSLGMEEEEEEEIMNTTDGEPKNRVFDWERT